MPNGDGRAGTLGESFRVTTEGDSGNEGQDVDGGFTRASNSTVTTRSLGAVGAATATNSSTAAKFTAPAAKAD